MSDEPQHSSQVQASCRKKADALDHIVKAATKTPEYKAYEKAIVHHRTEMDAFLDPWHPSSQIHARDQHYRMEANRQAAEKAGTELHARLERDGVGSDQMVQVLEALANTAEKTAKATGKQR